ncbi:hypothetical protein FKP32DRAFT_1544737, partial [Trametes sanguinea]
MIRGSNLKGFNIPNMNEILRATLFADDTTTFLAEGDDFADLQAILDKWCLASKARFNMGKTEIVPVGAKRYREEMVSVYRSTGRWKNYPTGVRIAGEGEAVRVLGSFIGNGLDQKALWKPKMAKLLAVMERWKAGRATVEGKTLVTQMIVGGMTQFLTGVQRMPQAVAKEVSVMIRNYIWEDNGHVPIAMERLYEAKENGGLGLLDIEARNEAVDIVWLRDYLTTGPKRP